MADSCGKIHRGKFRNWTVVGKGEIRRGEIIGKGGESEIYRGSYNSKHVALKVVSNLRNSNETHVLQNLEHPNIIKYIYHEIVDRQTYIVLELCHCNLQQYVDNRKEGGNEEIALRPIDVLRQIVAGVSYLHNGQTYWTVHRDLKPSNILFVYVERDGVWRVKISDFGLSKDIDYTKSSTNSDVKGSSGYTAPEVLKFMCQQQGTKEKLRIKKEADIFSMGIIFYYTLSDGKHPFGDDPLKRDENIRDAQPDLSQLKAEYGYDAREIIEAMLHKETEKRITAGMIEAHFIFWTAAKTLEFYQDLSDTLNDRGKHQTVKNKLESKCREITGGNWKSKLSGQENPAIAEVFARRAGPKKALQNDKVEENNDGTKKSPGKKKNSMPPILDLIRQIRNWGHHYNDDTTSDELRKELGCYPDGLMQFIKRHFPLLLPNTYDVVMKELRDTGIDRLKKYYHTKVMTPTKKVKVDKLACTFFKTALTDDSDDILSLDSENEVPSEDMQIPVITPRNYQLELAEQAKRGYNSLIIAPTGSGKTVVAYEIIRNHLQKSDAKSILFFVSKTTLALQQHRFFKCYLHQLDEELIDYIIGENSTHAPTGAVLKGRRLVVLTPQILIDEMKRTRPSIKFSDFSLLIFDECHNATKRHPYKQVMDMLLDSQAQNPAKIQVVGMTASLGVGKGKSQEKVLGNLLTLLANLNIMQCPVTVVRHVGELKQHQNEIKESHIKVRIHDDNYSLKILKAIELIENEIRSKELFGSQPHQVKEPPADKTKQTYEQWVTNLVEHVKQKRRVTDPNCATMVTIYAKHLLMYYNLLYLKKHIPHAINYTSGLASSDQNSDQGAFLRRINRSLEDASINSEVPMLEKLFDELKKQFMENSDSRCIIFVPRKNIAKALTKSIENDSSLSYLKPIFLTGSNDTEASGCMTKTDQKIALEQFRDGKSKVLIATSVAEEGLDIRECNLVIMYNYVTGEVGRIQRAGRGRAENSKSILIAPYGSGQIEQERKNADCARASEEAITDLERLSDEVRVRKITKIQRDQARDRRSEREEAVRLLDEAKRWLVLCGTCQKYLTSADRIKEIQGKHKFVMDSDFCKKVNKKEFRGAGKEITPGISSTARFICNGRACMNYLGLEMQHKNKRFPTLKVEQLIFEDEYGNRHTCKQWNKCKFQIERYPDESDDEEDETGIPSISTSKTKNMEVVVGADTISNDVAYEYVNNWNHFVKNR